jgi:hypothetical protein
MNDENSGLIPVTDHELFMATTAKGFEPGQVIFGRFVLRRVLGRGGMGIVWLAHDNQLEQDVAIKVLPDVVMHDREAVSDMKRETKRSLQLNHHNIVRIYDFNQDDKGAGISMEFVDGETLSSAKVEQPNGCFQVEEVGPWMEQICEALAYAHDTAKIVHRDLKPANIMLSKNNTIKVTDFGIARSISDSVSRVSMRHASSGTMVYMSPQQSSGARSSSSDDIYALGATVYDLLTGKPPFYSGNIQHQLESITPPTMTARRAELERTGTPIPEAWEKAIAACLEKEPAKRPSSVRDLAQRLNLHVTTRVSSTPAPQPDTVLIANPAAKVPPSSSVLPPTAPPGPPRQPLLPPGLFTPARVKLLGVGAGVVLLLLAIPLVIMWVMGRGSIAVATNPPGAVVAMGGKSLTSPATFSQVWSGKKVVDITLDGFESVEIPVDVTKNKVADLGTINLTRSTGSVVIHSIPPQAACTLKLTQSPVAGETANLSGRTPWKVTELGTGTYTLTTSADDFSDGTDMIEIKRGQVLEVTADLVKDDALHLLAPDQITAVSGDQPIPPAMKQDEAARSSLISFYQQTFHGYMKVDEFKMAESQLKRLSDELGVTTTGQEKQLDENQKDWTEDENSTFKDLLGKGRFASAEALLDQMDADETQPATAGMRDALAKAKAAHEVAIAKILANIDALNNDGKQDDAYHLAVESAAHDPEEPRLQQRLATFELPMPSTYERVTNRFKAMDALLTLDSTMSQNAEFMRLYGIFQTNVNRHEEFRAQMAPLEHQLDEFNSRIGDLRAEQVHNEKKATGYKVLSIFGIAGGIAGAAENSTPGAVAGFGAAGVGQNGADARENDVHRLQDEIDEVRGQRAPVADQLDAIRSQYDALQKTPIDQVQ